MSAAHAMRRLEEVGFAHQQATSVVEIIQGEVIGNVATRDYVGEQTTLVRKELAEQSGEIRTELPRAIGRSTPWMNGFLVALLIAVLGMLGVLIGKL